MNKNRVILLIIICFFSQKLVSQEYIFDTYNTEHGLPSSEIYHVFQDSKGYIWFATDNGVSRYNGYEFENFDINDGLAENAISQIYEDRFGKIWFIGITGKLSYQKGSVISKYAYNKNISQILPENVVTLKMGFCVDSLQNVYVSFKSHDLFKISKNGDIVSYLKTAISRNTQTIYKIVNQYIPAIKSNLSRADWIKFDLLIYKNAQSETFIHLPKPRMEYPHHLYAHFINDSSFWFSSGSTVYYIENDYIKYKKEFSSNIIWLQAKGENELWICPVKDGIHSFEISKNTLEPKLHLLKGYTISSTLHDNYGSYWFTTLNNGVFKMNFDNLVVLDKKKGLIGDKVSCIEVSGDSLWVGYQSNQLSLIEEEKIKHLTFSENDNTSVKKLYYDREKKTLFIATTDYLFLCKESQIKTIKKTNFSKLPEISLSININDLTPVEGGGYWVAGGEGFYFIMYNQIIFDSWKDKNFIVRVNSIKLDKHKTVWLGCRDGLRSFKNGKLYYWGNDFEKLKYRVLDIIIDKDVLILATKGKGILFFDGKTVKQITKKDGLSSNMITSLALNNKQLWAGSLNGINKINILNNRPDDNNIEAQILTELSDFEINQIKIHKSKMYLATNKGVVIYDISSEHVPDITPPFYFKNFTVNGHAIPLKESFYLLRNQNNLSISFEALDFHRNLPLQYKYRLNGLDSNWVTTTRRNVNYYYLPPGKYEFVAMVKGQKGQWIEPPIKLKFRIAPAIWQTIPFKIGGILLFITLLSLIYRIKLADAHNKIRLKNKLYDYKLQTLLGQMRPHFIFNTLNSINNYIVSNDPIAASKYLSRFSSLIRKILEHSQNERISLHEELKTLELYLKIEAMRMRHKFEYSIDIEKEINVFETKLPSLILQPFVENSIWHGIQPLGKKGVIKIKISKKGSNLAVEIIDNGIGRENAILLSRNKPSEKKSLGTKISKERLELLAKKINGQALIEYVDLYAKNKSIGTKVKISLPLLVEKKQN